MKLSKFCIICILIMSIAYLVACGKNTSYTLSGDYMEYDTAQQIVDSSDLVFSGKVVDIQYEMLDIRTNAGTDSLTGLANSESIPYTLYEIEIIEMYKGSYEGSNDIILKRPGGVFDDATYELENASDILVDEQYLFLAAEYTNSYPSLMNATQASYNLNAPSVASNETAITLSEILAIFEK